MKIEIVDYRGDLKREVWIFTLLVGYGRQCIYIDSYSFQTKLSTRHKSWKRQTQWDRLEHRTNNLDSPFLPDEIVASMREKMQEYVATLPIVK